MKKIAITSCVLFACLLARSGRAEGPPPGAPANAPRADESEQLVERLASDDAQVRSAAVQKLQVMGAAARPALLKAMNGPAFRARQEASTLLLKRPFDRPDDPPAVAEILRTYGQGDVAARKTAVGRIVAQYPKREDAAGVLRRLVREDPSDDVRWAVLAVLHTLPTLAVIAAGEQDAEIDRAPNLALAAATVEQKEPARAITLWERCLALDAKSPTTEPEVVLVHYRLAALYVRDRRYDDAAEMHRQGHARRPQAVINRGGRPTDHLTLLFSLHARYGPLRGFDDDVAAHPAAVTTAPLAYAVARAYERGGHRLTAAALYRTAALVVPPHATARHRSAEFLLGLGLERHAEPLFRDIVKSADQPPPPVPAARGAAPAPGAPPTVPPPTPNEVIDARLQLALIAGRRGDDFAAAEALRQIIDTPLPGGVRLARGIRREASAPPGTVSGPDPGADALTDLRTQMHWRFLRHARAKNNTNSIKAHAKELAKLAPDNPEVIVDAAPALKQIGQPDDASRLFDAAYARRKAQLAQKPDDPLLMNNLAWLCARCGEKLDEAKFLIEAALKADPNNPAFLDTSAEVHFQLGQIDRAIELETRALDLRPDDPFMTEQLERFRKAKQKSR